MNLGLDLVVTCLSKVEFHQRQGNNNQIRLLKKIDTFVKTSPGINDVNIRKVVIRTKAVGIRFFLFQKLSEMRQIFTNYDCTTNVYGIDTF